ncbi:MAG: hypothetical protein OXE99_07515 [Cellvibrionales bacterium]|nr:hypothetical protein [Cellvibrionales bacterium]
MYIYLIFIIFFSCELYAINLKNPLNLSDSQTQNDFFNEYIPFTKKHPKYFKDYSNYTITTTTEDGKNLTLANLDDYNSITSYFGYVRSDINKALKSFRSIIAPDEKKESFKADVSKLTMMKQSVEHYLNIKDKLFRAEDIFSILEKERIKLLFKINKKINKKITSTTTHLQKDDRLLSDNINHKDLYGFLKNNTTISELFNPFKANNLETLKQYYKDPEYNHKLDLASIYAFLHHHGCEKTLRSNALNRINKRIKKSKKKGNI